MNIVIVAAKRSPIGSFNGSLSKIKLSDLNKQLINNILSDVGVRHSDITQVIMGHVLTAGFGQNTARQSAIAAGIPKEITSYTINQVCGSGMKAITLGYQTIIQQLAFGVKNSIILAGGYEIMSQAPHNVFLRNKANFGHLNLQDSIVTDGLTDIFNNVHMGMTAEAISNEYSISRAMQDAYALQSQMRATDAQKNNYFDNEIVKIALSDVNMFTNDEFVRADTSAEKLSKLRSAFIKDGTVTAGNASGINDGSAILLLMTEDTAIEKGLKPLAKIISFAEAGVDPMLMGIGPVPASKKALEIAGWTIKDLDLIEVNEAFAAQSIAVNQLMGWDVNKVNVNGGAIALGHPIGASGARIVVTLLHEMYRKNLKRGLATACIGGGMGIAMCIEMLS